MLTTSFGSPAPPSLAPLAAAAVEEEWEFVFRTKPVSTLENLRLLTATRLQLL